MPSGAMFSRFECHTPSSHVTVSPAESPPHVDLEAVKVPAQSSTQTNPKQLLDLYEPPARNEYRQLIVRMVAESAQFKKAEEDVKKLDKKPGNDEMLKVHDPYANPLHGLEY